MENAVVVVAVQNEAVVGFPTIGVDRRSFQDFPLNIGHQLFLRAIRNDRSQTLSRSSLTVQKPAFYPLHRALFCRALDGLQIRFIQLKFAQFFLLVLSKNAAKFFGEFRCSTHLLCSDLCAKFCSLNSLLCLPQNIKLFSLSYINSIYDISWLS